MRHLTYAVPFLLLIGCATLVRVGSASGGAALGSLAGPSGAALGAMAGVILADSSMSPQEPQSVWEIVSQLLTQAQWLAYAALGLWIMTWIAPPPQKMLKALKDRFGGKKKTPSS